MAQKENHFKKCPMCAKLWQTREKFLDDATIQLNGYQADFEAVEKGLFLFTHHTEGCYSTLAFFTTDFFDLYSGKIYPEKKTGSEECPGYCRRVEKLDRCEAECRYAFVREIIQIIRERQST